MTAYRLGQNLLTQSVEDLTETMPLAQLQNLNSTTTTRSTIPNEPPERTKRSRFMDLPTELRLLTYDAYFDALPFEHAINDESSYVPRYYGREALCDTTLLRVCHQIRNEALDSYIRRLWHAENNLRREEYAYMQSDWLRHEEFCAKYPEWGRRNRMEMFEPGKGNDVNFFINERRGIIFVLLLRIREAIMRADREVVLGLQTGPVPSYASHLDGHAAWKVWRLDR